MPIAGRIQVYLFITSRMGDNEFLKAGKSFSRICHIMPKSTPKYSCTMR